MGLTTLPSTIAPAADRPFPGPRQGTVVNPHGWFLTFAGKQIEMGDRVFLLMGNISDRFFVIGELIVENAIIIVYFIENENDLDDEFYA